MSDNIEIYGAREHNLKNINVTIPRNKFVVITGLSGSGKSSLAFNTIFAEGQRRYIETFSAYARQFLGGLERPDVDKIDGLSPVIAIEQKTTNKNPRSTVGTVTELYDFLRLLYARASDAFSYQTNEKMISYSDEQIIEIIQEKYHGKKLLLLAPVVRSRKGHYRELFEYYRKKGFFEARINGKIQEIEIGMKLDRYKTHDIEIVIDKWKIDDNALQDKRISDSLHLAMELGEGIVMIQDIESQETRYFSRALMCPSSGISYPLPEPNSFSFNSPKGACPKCNGLGEIRELSYQKMIPNDELSFQKQVFAPFEFLKHTKWLNNQIELILLKNGHKLSTSYNQLDEKTKKEIEFGLTETFELKFETAKITKKFKVDFEGLIPYFERLMEDKMDTQGYHLISKFSVLKICPICEGRRLKKESLFFKIANKNISEVSQYSLAEFATWLDNIQEKLSEKQQIIGNEIIKEIQSRLHFLLEVGLDYLSLNRATKTLSGGESQRIRLATQIGTELMNVLYILDEPSIGLHQRDNIKLIRSLQKLRDIGNSVIVVEHDKEMILEADEVIDLGPKAGKHGGEIVWQGNPETIHQSHTLTSQYINGEKQIEIPEKRRTGNGNQIILQGAAGNNLKNVTLKIPLGKLVCVTGVSGGGKSSLINGTLYPILNKYIYRAEQEPLPYKSISGLEYIDKVVDADQSPIGRTPRSNPATYTGVFTEIRNLFTALPEAKIRGYSAGRFSFNVKGGRCETCEGAGLKVIEMNFLPDVYVHCETCQGKRFNRETLEVRYKGKSIADVLEMTIDEAVVFFENIPRIYNKIKTLHDVGLGYITLGQQSTTLSGGEAQRVKLATELSKKQTGKTIYILDEPTTGLHFEDIRVLMDVIQKLVNFGNTVLIIEHNLEVIKLADWIIDIGPEGGNKGGTIVAEGTPEYIITNKKSYTAKFLKQELKL